MSPISGDEPTTEPAPARAGASSVALDLQGGLGVCPFLRSRDGGWSSVHPSRDLRCWAVDPAAQLAAQKQRQLCVTAGHTSCATYAAAVLVDGAADRDADGAGLWPDASPVPVALESVHARAGGRLQTPRSGGQAALVGVMLVALVVLLIARANPLAGPGPGLTASPPASASVASAAAGASSAPSVLPSPTVAVTPLPATPAPTAAPTPTPVPSASPRTYKVRSGDTIAGIAAKLGSTVKAIVAANNIVDPRLIRPGQILIIP
jgi:LysM repeat protein